MSVLQTPPPKSLRKRVRALLALLAFALALLGRTDSVTAQVPSPGSIRFRGHMAIGFSEGEFRRWQFTRAVIDEDHPEHSEIEVAIDLASLDTGNDTRDRHLRSADFFDVARYPTATVRVSEVEVEDAEHFMAKVQLDLHGRSRSFPVRFAIVDRAARRIAGDTLLKRSDFGVGATGSFFNPLHVDDEVHITIEATVPVSRDSSASIGDHKG